MACVSLVGPGLTEELSMSLNRDGNSYLASVVTSSISGVEHLVATEADLVEVVGQFVLALGARLRQLADMRKSPQLIRPAQKESLLRSVPPELRGNELPAVLVIGTDDNMARISADILSLVIESVGAPAPQVVRTEVNFSSVLAAILGCGAQEVNPLGWLVHRPAFTGGGERVVTAQSDSRGPCLVSAGSTPATFAFLNTRKIDTVLRVVQEASVRGWNIVSAS